MNITIEATENEIGLARNFATIYDEGGYGKNVLNVSHEEFIHFIFIGKLTELVVKKYFEDNEIDINTDSMLVPDPNEFRVGADIILNYSNQEIDIKAANKNFHTRLLVREDQFQAHIHDIYIGTKCTDNKNVTIHGYVKGNELAKNSPQNFGTGDCRAIKLSELEPIVNLIVKAKNKTHI